MIPKYLKIKGLYSYQTEQEIHFDALTDASLFGIFGAVGSGKSSILEAITFALYGDTERLNKSGDDRTYNMMNLRSDELLIDFECIAGKDAQKYRFTVRGKRNSKNFKDVKTFERRAYIWENEMWVPLPENVNAESIIGLSYDNFRRTIIIPQGRFQEFIELKDADRTRMMKELFQLEKYDLSRNVGTLGKRNDIAISNLEGQLTGLGDVVPEMLEEAQTKRNNLLLQITKTSEEFKVQADLENTFQQIKAAADKIRILSEKQAGLTMQQPEMVRREDALLLFETCSLHFKSLFDQKKNLTASIAKDEKLFSENEKRTHELTTLVSVQHETLSRLRPQYEAREELLDIAGELEKVIGILQTGAALEKRKEALARGEEQLREKEKSIEILKSQKLEKEVENEKRKGKTADIQEIGLVKSWYATADSLAENRQAIKKEAEDLQAEIEKQRQLLREKIAEIAKNVIPDLDPEPALDAFRNGLIAFFNQTEIRRRELADNLLKINTRISLQQYAVDLAEGDACPLCGSVHHPELLHADQHLAAEAAQLKEVEKKLDEEERRVRSWQLPVERIFGQIESLEKQKESIRQRFAETKVRIATHEKQFVWPAFDMGDRAGFERHFDEVNKNQTQIREAENALKVLAGRIDFDTKEKTEQIEKPLQMLREEIARQENTIATLSGQLKKTNAEQFRDEPLASVQEKIKSLNTDYHEITRLFEQTEKQADLLEKERDILSGSQQTLHAALTADRTDLAAANHRISLLLLEHGFGNEEQVSEILAKSIPVAAERKAIEEFKLELESISRELEMLRREHPDQQYDAERHAATIQARDHLNATLQTLRREEGALDGQLKKIEADLARKTAMMQDLGRLRLRKEHLDELARLFRSSGFVDYASSIYLKNLIQAANHRFHQMTHQRLHLELGEGNSFWVRDLLNGGHMRLLKTLSGGQKFQAALSLALALADHIHIRNESRHNFFFLDEGFGSLDKNALQTVFETLKSLRKENRIVGIISHVEDLQQEIQMYLQVTDTEEGSRIVPSWK